MRVVFDHLDYIYIMICMIIYRGRHTLFPRHGITGMCGCHMPINRSTVSDDGTRLRKCLAASEKSFPMSQSFTY